jgi:ribosomal protein L27
MIDVDSKIGPVSRVGWGVEVGKKLVTCVPRQRGENVAPGMNVGVGVGVRFNTIALGEGDVQLARRSMTLVNKKNLTFILINPGVN